MVFYFSGTGNSLAAAKKIAEETGDYIIDITKCKRQDYYRFELKEHEKIGIVFPVYWYGMPTVVEEFIKKLTLENYQNNFSYAVVTCGGSIANTVLDVKKLLLKKGIELNSGYSLLMPDNYIVLMPPPSEEKEAKLLRAADKELRIIASDVRNKRDGIFRMKKGPLTPISKLVHRYYVRHAFEGKFMVESSCNGCGLCASNCPCDVIVMKDGRPTWKGDCTFCLACINRCPKEAIQYGTKTKERKRYRHPGIK